jgi:hypothetical protein
MEDDPRRHGLRAGFDLAAEDYQRTRPVRYSADDYLANLATQSGTRALGEARSAEFLTRVRHRLEPLGWPQLTATFVGYLTVGRRT